MKEEVRDLPCKLNEEERVMVQAECVRTADVLAETQDAKKRAVKEWDKKIDEFKTQERKQRKAAISGEIDRPVKCVEHIDPESRTAQWFRSDLGVAIGEMRAATPEEVRKAKHELFMRQQGGLFRNDPDAPDQTPTNPTPKKD